MFRLLLSFTAGLLLVPAAFAHARLLRSTPERGAELTAPPAEIALWFNELLDAGFHAIEVFPAAELARKPRRNLATEKPVVNPRDRTQLRTALGPLPPGDYVVEWRVLSRDGHSAPGRFTFRILAR